MPAVETLVQDRIATITMHGEPANALGEELKAGLTGALGEAEIDAEAMRIAASLAAGPFDALAATVRCVDAARDLPLAEGLAVERDEILNLFDSTDAREGIAAFLGKRRPIFS